MTLASNKEEEHLLNSGCEEKAATSDDKGPASTSSSSRFDWRSWRDKRPYLVEPPLFLFYIAYKACLPLTEQFIFSFTAAKYLPNKGDYYLTVSSRETACQANVTSRPVDWLQDAIHADSSNWLCYLNLARNIPALFTTLLICSFTDVSGRKFGLILPCLGAVMKGLVYLIVIYGKAPIIYLFIGNILEGLGGSHMTLHSSAFAYLSEVLLNDRHRSFRFTIVQAVICLATAIGNLVMGHIIRTWGYAVSFLFVTVLFLATTLHVIFLLPESKPAASQRDERDFSVSHTLRNAVTVFHVYSREDRNPTTNLKLRLLLLVFTFDSLIVLGRNDVDVLYMMGMPFCWPSVVIGYYQALRYVLQAAVGLVCFPVMQLWFSDSCLGFVGTVSGIASNALMAINLNSLLLWFGAYALHIGRTVYFISQSSINIEPI